jgi:hypothetical protein
MRDVRVSIEINDLSERTTRLYPGKSRQEGVAGVIMQQMLEKLCLFSSEKRTVKS